MNLLLIRPKSTYADVVAGIPIGITMLGAVAEKKGHRAGFSISDSKPTRLNLSGAH